jgi:hypothetical protein
MPEFYGGPFVSKFKSRNSLEIENKFIQECKYSFKIHIHSFKMRLNSFKAHIHSCKVPLNLVSLGNFGTEVSINPYSGAN